MISKAKLNAFVATAHLAYSKQMAHVRSREKKGEDMSCVIHKLLAAYGVIRYIGMYVQNFTVPASLTNDDVVQSAYWVMDTLQFKYDLQNGVELTGVNNQYITISEL